MMGAISKAKITAAITLILTIFLHPLALATDPYSGSDTKNDLQVGLPSGGSMPSNGILPGTKIVITGDGFKSNSKYDILWDGKVVVDPYANAAGSASYEYTIPSGASAGTHTLSMQGIKTDGTTLVHWANIVVRSTGSGGISSYPFTGGGLLQYLLVAGIVFLLVGFGVKAFKRVR